jgi:hypothetical protein
MVNAIGSSTLSGSANFGNSTAGLEAQLDRYQKELSSCVNCSSTSNTPEGREKIQSISNKISTLHARIAEITTEKSNTQQAALNAKKPADLAVNMDVPTSTTQYSSTDTTVAATGSKTATVGNRLDVFA